MNDRSSVGEKIRELTVEEKKKVERAHNIVLMVLAIFIFLNIAGFMWFLLTKLPR